MTKRHWAYAIICCCWLGAIGLLFLGTTPAKSFVLPENANQSHLYNSKSYLALTSDSGERFGYSVSSRDPQADSTRLILRENNYFKLQSPERGKFEPNTLSLIYCDRNFDWDRITYAYVEGAAYRLHYEATLDDGALQITLKINNQTSKHRISFTHKPELLATIIPRLVRSGRFAPGFRELVTLLDIPTLTIENAVLTIGTPRPLELSTEQILAFPVTINRYGIEEVFWYTKSGLPIKRDHWFPYQALRENPDQILSTYWPSMPFVQLSEARSFTVPVSDNFTAQELRTAAAVSYQTSATSLPSSAYQLPISGQQVLVSRFDPKYNYSIPLQDKKHQPELLFSLFAGSDATSIRQHMLQVIGSERRARQAVEHVLAFSQYLPPATPLIVAPQGLSLSSQSWLDNGYKHQIIVAMLQSVGIPARMVAGVVRKEDHWRYDYWAEVFLGQYVPLDINAATFPAPPNRLALLVGRPEHFTGVNKLLSGLQIVATEIKK